MNNFKMRNAILVVALVAAVAVARKQEVTMSIQESPASIWQESMRIGIPEFDGQRKAMAEMIELLDVDPAHSITDELFLSRLAALQTEVMSFCQHEKDLMDRMPLPDNLKARHIADHLRILDTLVEVYMDSMARKERNALEVYRSVRDMIEEHLLNIARNLKAYVAAM